MYVVAITGERNSLFLLNFQHTVQYYFLQQNPKQMNQQLPVEVRGGIVNRSYSVIECCVRLWL